MIGYVIPFAGIMAAVFVGAYARSKKRNPILWALMVIVTMNLVALAIQKVILSKVEAASGPEAEGLMGIVIAGAAAFLAIPLAFGVALRLLSFPAYRPAAGKYRVHFRDEGSGTLSIEGGSLVLQRPQSKDAILLTDIAEVAADGELLRIAKQDGGSVYLHPLGEPESPEMRRKTAKVLARRIGRIAAAGDRVASSDARQTAVENEGGAGGESGLVGEEPQGGARVRPGAGPRGTCPGDRGSGIR